MYGQVLEGFQDESGIFAVMGHYQAYLGLHAMQHRGTKGATMVASDGSMLRSLGGQGLVQEVFGGAKLRELRGTIAVGQTNGVGLGDTAMNGMGSTLFARYSGARFASRCRADSRMVQRCAMS